MKIAKLCYDPSFCNTYVLGEEGEPALIIDPGYNHSGALNRYITKHHGGKILAIALTHGHFDHVLALGKLKREYPDLKIAVSEKDAVYLSDGGERISGDIALFDTGSFYNRLTSLLPVPGADILLSDGDEIADFRVIGTPGHTKGSICLYSEKEKVIFTGDTLFSGSIGRTDMPGGSYRDICSSLTKLKALPGDTAVFPGHGPSTTIANEVKNNPYM